MFKALFIAFQLMTRLPTPVVVDSNSSDYGRSVIFYPLVGLMIGSILYGLLVLSEMWLMQDHALLVAALVLMVWVMLTGALHLDGLADSADAWLGGFGDKQRTLEIMKDPYAGPAAVVAVMLLLLIKFSALTSLVSGDFFILLFVPLLARSSVMMLFLTTNYVREKGIASELMAGLPRITVGLVIVVTWTASIYLLGSIAVFLLAAMLVSFILLRFLMIKRIGGMTGDTAGAMIEITEAVLLTVLVSVAV